ncbi:hypothetical protein AAJCM20276_27010 [Acetobacter aceti]|uniref:Uncharacterized protein n=1 Tax=Acetobacter aceti TaxID=435 RepID=A0A6S6PGD5_ACEAC|nr:hypothetical protein [Acetobacter aceti]BCI68077.1 hypothetical protein AAJCM20276_27010 [Acetobacter aceti]
MPVEAYEIAVKLTANATSVVGPIGEIIRSLERLIGVQKEAQSNFNAMASSIGGARRLAASLATDLERAARASRDLASSSGRVKFGGVGSGSGSSGGVMASAVVADSVVRQAQTSRTPIYDAGGSYVTPYSAAATNVPGAPMLMLPPPRASGTASAVIHGQGNSWDAGATFRSTVRPNGYTPDWGDALDISGASYGRPFSGSEYGPWLSAGNAPSPGSGLQAARNAAAGIGLSSIARSIGPYAGMAAGYMGLHGAAHMIGSGFDQNADAEQAFIGMMGDPSARQNMPAIRAIAASIMADNNYILPSEAARMAQESFSLSGGNIEESRGIARMLNRIDKTFLLTGKGHEQAMRESIGFIRAEDISNRFFDPKTGQFSMERANASTSAALGMYLANQQFMSGRKYQSFASSAGLAAQGLSDAGTLNLAHFIDLQPNKAGMQLRSFENLFSTNHRRMTKKDAAYFRSIGIIDGHDHVIDQDLRKSDPIEWINQHLVPLIGKHPELLDMIQRMNVSDFIGEGIGARGNVARQKGASMRTSAEAAVKALENGPRAQQAAFHASFERMEGAIGKAITPAMIQGMDALTKTFNGLSSYISSHPNDIAQFARDISALVSVVGGIASAIGKVMSYIPGPIRRIVESTAAGAAAGAGAGAVFGGVGAAPGAIGGAVVGLVGGVANEGAVQSRHISASGQPHVTITPAPVVLDGKKIGEVNFTAQYRSAMQELRATSSHADGLSSPQLPNAAWAH